MGPHKGFHDSGTTAHMMKGVLVIIYKAVLSDFGIGTAANDMTKAADHSGSVVKLYGGKKPVILNQVLRVADVENSLISIWNLYNHDRTVEYTRKACTVKKRNGFVDIGKRVHGTYSTNLQQASDRALKTFNATGSMLSSWYAKLAHVDCNAMRKTAQQDAVYGLEMVGVVSKSNCSPWVDWAMTNMPKWSRTTL